MKLTAPNSIFHSDLVFNFDNQSLLTQQAGTLAKYIRNPWLFKDGLTLGGTIVDRNGRDIPSRIEVELAEHLDSELPFWKNIKAVRVTPETNENLGITFAPNPKGFWVHTYIGYEKTATFAAKVSAPSLPRVEAEPDAPAYYYENQGTEERTLAYVI